MVGGVQTTPNRKGGGRRGGRGRGRYQPVVELVDSNNNDGREAQQDEVHPQGE